jgi:hypothetical protein
MVGTGAIGGIGFRGFLGLLTAGFGMSNKDALLAEQKKLQKALCKRFS